MPVIPLIDGILAVATEIVKYAALLEQSKYVDRVRSLKLEIEAAKRKAPADIIDSEIEDMEAQLLIEVDTMQSAIQQALAGKK